MSIDRKNLLLYAVTDRAWTGKKTLTEQIEEALSGGVTCVQLREKGLSEAEFVDEAVKVGAVCRAFGVPLIINDNLSVALASGADGIHVGAEDMAVSEIRARTGRDFIIGATAKTVAAARKAEADGADYLGVGAVFPSPTKKNAVRIDARQLKEICSSVSIPAVAIGGINLSNVDGLSGCRMSGIAVVSAIFAAEDIASAARELKRRAAKAVEE